MHSLLLLEGDEFEATVASGYLRLPSLFDAVFWRMAPSGRMASGRASVSFRAYTREADHNKDDSKTRIRL